MSRRLYSLAHVDKSSHHYLYLDQTDDGRRQKNKYRYAKRLVFLHRKQQDYYHFAS